MLQVERPVLPDEHAPPQVPDAALLASAQEGSIEAFGILYLRHVHRVEFPAQNILGIQAVDDAMGDMFVRAWDRLSGFNGNTGTAQNGTTGFGNWIGTMASRYSLDAVRTQKRRRTDTIADIRDEMLSRAENTIRSTHDAVLNGEHGPLLNALNTLTPAARHVIIETMINGLSVAEYADIHGVEHGAVKSRLKIGTKKLLEAAGVVSGRKSTPGARAKLAAYIDAPGATPID